MLVVLKSNYEELSQEAARIVANSIRQNPEVRLGLATGSTTIGVYRELARLHREEALDFSLVVTFNLDEYLGISLEHPQSFHHFMREHFFSRVNLDPRNIHIPDGTISGDYEKYCAGYEDEIQRAGGIDLEILWRWGEDAASRDHNWNRHDTGQQARAYVGYRCGKSGRCCERDRGASH